ncbi:MAG: hypothetical protein GQ540_03040 [Lutibacter sp.]|uniref:hypothetical protein n=1 Tax=Lutibacter sp. TaxID=1925666 RepID=UPI001A0180E3|nr:hypothetical protein [Lutibacter sp.]NOR27486.1 hypothetical protein [Lutibacter sp.]
MKNIWLLITVLLVSCKPCQNIDYNLKEAVLIKTANCPDNAECSVELIPNKSLEFKKDGIGALYPVITEGDKTILKYTFNKNTIPNTQDGSYTEVVFAELDKTITHVSLTSKELQTVKLHFGRLCYCKGQTGYYPITNGNFNIKKSGKKSIEITIDFKISEVPQIISKINEIVSLKSNATN